ncbi:hypothetical protein FAUST_2966 [Fusarium austroamericanum]|uniref:SAC3/GANP/THP3 conserved domain-containing protein n=1 Tax=Fusarium austroamericanum TaxID=282268 RepID=A0AAN6C5P2_FUSAU|nr:hypothetical protein FAUST_2966 [Fusarium austroamericanum]
MPRKWIDKKSAQHFTLVHRPQNDPLIHDENAPSMVLNPTQTKKGSSKSKDLDDLASELGYEAEGVRANEGEAASYGVYYDDTEYDYMQHLRDLNTGGGEVVFVESSASANKGKGKQKQSLEDALKKMDIEQSAEDILDEDMLPSKNLTRATYEAQQDIPDSLKGFQPDMDPRLREVLEALEDDAFVDEDDDIFKELAKDGRELEDYEFDEAGFDEDDGWESDATAKPTKEFKDDDVPQLVKQMEQPEEGPSQDWLEDFKQFKKEQKVTKAPVAPSQSEMQSMWTTTTNGGRRKKRKGALTDNSSYSMTSSSLVRTEQMTLLDARFDKIEEAYNEDMDDDMQSVSAVSTMSTVQGPLRSDFDGIMDDFLGNFTKPGKRTNKKNKAQTGLEQLDEIRQGLGPARIRGRMSATFVASSNQMFSAFGQPTRSPSPAFNPFATKSEDKGSAFGVDGASDSSKTKRNKRTSAFGDHSDSEAKRKAKAGFKGKDANLSDGGGRPKGRKGDDKKNNDSKKNPFGAFPSTKKPAGQNARNNGSNPFATTRDESRPTSSSSADAQDDHVPEAHNSNDPHAKRVYEQLRKDGIHPPQWPSQPGNPKNKGEVTKFREKYETYRSKARASLTKAGLIDDPEKRKTLQDAIDFKGICEDMCPEYEKITRINEMDVHQPEKNPKTTFANTSRMIKKLARSAAGQEAPLPMDVRSIPALKRTLDYLIDDLLREDGRLPGLHGFLWDRTRAIRRDFTFFSSLTPDEMKLQVYVLENIARFHVTALHLLTQEGKAPEDFVEQQELEQLGKALLSLRDAYDDCNDQGIRCENEPEFRAYYLIFHAYDSNIIETLQRQWKPNLWRDSDEVRTAVSLVEALQNTQDFHGPLKDAPSLAASSAYQSYFRIVEDPKVSYTMACFAECHFPRLRRCILSAIKRGLARPRETSKDVTAAELNKFLRFDTVEQAIEFAELHNIEFGECEENPFDVSLQYAKLDNRTALPHLRLQHQFSYSLVEKKRGFKTLPQLIHETTYEDTTCTKPKTNGSVRASAFAPSIQATNKPAIPTGPKSTTPSPFSSPSVSGGSWGNNKAINGISGTTFNGITPANGFAVQQPTPQPNTFSSGLTPAAKQPAGNPFAPATSASTPSLPGNAPAKTDTVSQMTQASGTTQPLNPFASSFKPPTTTDTSATRSPFGQPFASVNKENGPAAKPTFSFPSIKPAIPAAETASSKEESADKSKNQAITAESAKPPVINFIPPTPQLSSFPSNTTTQPQNPFTSSTSNSAPQSTPTTGFGLDGPTPKNEETPKPATSILGSQPPAASTPQFSFPSIGTPAFPTPAKSNDVSQPSTTLAAAHPPKEPSPPLALPTPPRDLLGDFTKWFVVGDNGLMDEFQAFMLDNILQGVYRKYVRDEEAKRKKEEEAQALAKAEQFRIYNLSVKYFYRWKEIARDLRLSRLRRSGREQMRIYYEEQRAAHAKAQKDAARRAAREKAEIAELNRPEELKDFLKHKKPSKRRQAEEESALLASGVLSGIDNEQEAITRIVRRAPSVASSVSSKQSSASRGGSKTRALRQQYGGDQQATFRRSLPPMASRNTSSPEPGNRVSRVSERWRLKAMGIVQLPDGTAVPESIANEMHHDKKRLGGSIMGPPSSYPIRRASGGDFARSETRQRISNSQDTIDTSESDSGTTKNKRKRAAEDDEAVQERQAKSSSHKRVMSDAQNLINELRAMREEMEEGATWFKDQNDRLQSELISRSSTPWEQDA